MKKSNLDLLAEDLRIVKSEVQRKQMGGIWEMSLPSIAIPGTPGGGSNWGFDDWPDNGTPSWGNNGASGNNMGGIGGGGGGGNIHDGNSGNDVTNISDPQKLLSGIESWLDSTIDAIKDLINSGNIPNNSQEYLKALEATQATLDAMEKSNYNFRIDSIQNNGDQNLDAYITYDSHTGQIVLGIENIANIQNISLLTHEITHLAQILNGDLWIENGKIVGYDINDEVEAYQRQHDIQYGTFAGNYDLAGNPVPDGNYRVTAGDVLLQYPGMYNDLPNHSISKPSIDDNNEGQPAGSGSSY